MYPRREGIDSEKRSFARAAIYWKRSISCADRRYMAETSDLFFGPLLRSPVNRGKS